MRRLLLERKKALRPSRGSTVPRPGSRTTSAARLLIVDDDAACLANLAMHLRSAGHDVVACTTGAEATLLGAVASPDVLIADLFLHPSCNGIDVALSLRAVLPKLEVIFMTGLPAIASRYVRRLNDAVIVKKSLSLAVLVEDILGLLAVLGPRGQ